MMHALEEDTIALPPRLGVERNDVNSGADDPLAGRGRLLDLDPHKIRAHPLLERLDLLTHVLATKPYLPLGRELRSPIVVTTDRFILRGIPERNEAIIRGQPTIQCLEYDYNAEEQVNYLVAKQACRQELNDFCRVLLALEWSDELRNQARGNQQLGGRCKGSTELSNALRIDVRASVAAKTGVSEGSVAKVQAILREGGPKLIKAAKAGYVKIDRAFKLLKPRESQERLLDEYLSRRSTFSIKTGIQQILRRHRHSKPTPAAISTDDLCRALAAMEPTQRSALQVHRLNAGQPIIAISDSLTRLIADTLAVEYVRR